VLFAQPVVQAIVSPIAGRLSDKYNPGNVASVGMFFTCTGLAMILIESFISSTLLVVASLMVFGFGFAMFSAPNTNAILGLVEKKRLGVASSIIATMRQLGNVLSMAMIMFIFSIVIGKVEITAEVYGEFLVSFRIGVSIITLLCISGIFASLARNSKPVHKEMNMSNP
jgi:MFS family permease